MGDIELTDEDIKFLLEQLHFAKQVSNRSFTRKLTERLETDPQTLATRAKGLHDYNERMDKLIAKFKGEKAQR